MSRGDWRRTTDKLRITRPRDAKPYTWPAALGIGVMWGVIMGIAVGFSGPGREFSFVRLSIVVVIGLVLYGPAVDWGSHRRT